MPRQKKVTRSWHVIDRFVTALLSGCASLFTSIACGPSPEPKTPGASAAAEAQEETMFGMPLDKEPEPSPHVGENEMAPPNDVVPTLRPTTIPSGRKQPEDITPSVVDPPDQDPNPAFDQPYRQVQP